MADDLIGLEVMSLSVLVLLERERQRNDQTGSPSLGIDNGSINHAGLTANHPSGRDAPASRWLLARRLCFPSSSMLDFAHKLNGGMHLLPTSGPGGALS